MSDQGTRSTDKKHIKACTEVSDLLSVAATTNYIYDILGISILVINAAVHICKPNEFQYTIFDNGFRV